MNLTIGVTGHRPHRIRLDPELLANRIEQVVQMFQQAAPEIRFTALSALAEGADRIFARQCLDADLRLHVLLPMPLPDYKRTFCKSHDNGAFDQLLSEADRVDACDGSPTDPVAAYEQLGRHIVAVSQLLFAIWDGSERGGRGGTAWVVNRAIAHRRPVVWIDANADREAQLLTPGAGGGPLTAAQAKYLLSVLNCQP